MHRNTLLFLCGLMAGVFFVTAARVSAGPISGTAGGWPYTKLGIFQGVLSIAPTASGTMELGANGKDIAASGQIIIRPNTVSAANGAIFLQQGGATQLKVPGKIWLYPNGTDQAPVAYNIWPSGTASQWNRMVESSGFPILQPATTGLGVGIGSVGLPVSGGTALHLSQSNFNEDTYALEAAQSSDSERAIDLQGDLLAESFLSVSGKILINNQEVFHPGGDFAIGSIPANQGVGSGLDADFVDGYDVTIENGANCGATACLCFNFSGATGKKCAPLTNHL